MKNNSPYLTILLLLAMAVSSGHTRAGTLTDTDNDGLPDDWEMKYFTNLKQGPSDDPDKDGLTNIQEYQLGTDPTKADTDGDGFSDFYEVHFLTNPLDANSFPKAATANIFTGPDAGQGLDLTGTFPYAVTFGDGSQAGGQIHDANFLASGAGNGLPPDNWTDYIPGVTTVAMHANNNWNGNDVNGWPDFGTSAGGQVLADMMRHIQWSEYVNATTPTVSITLTNLKVGGQYKLQLLFAEYQWARGFDILVNGRQIAKAFAPFQWQGGFVNTGSSTPRTNGVVVTDIVIPNTTAITVILDGRGVTTASTDPVWRGISDGNAIIEALTLEQVSAPADSDSDGLWDAWEMQQFGNLNQKGTDDPDKDGLTNAQEFTASTDPNNPDSDGDGLTDGDEVNKYKTDPLKADTDGDGLTDGDEVNKYKTDPLKTDTDGDGISDYLEVTFYHTDPLKAAPIVTVSNPTAVQVTSGDPGGGLDLQGRFVYAINVSTAGAAGKAGDANFLAETTPGIKITAVNNIANWDTPAIGTGSPNDLVIDKVLQSIRYQGPTVTLEIDNLFPGGTYKMQTLYYEQCCIGRGFNIYQDGQLIIENFSPPAVQGGVNNTAAGAAVVWQFTTAADKTLITFTKNGVTDETLTDPNPILDGFTLEYIPGADSDKDGMPDDWETHYFGNLTQGAADDFDKDGMTNLQEYTLGTDPTKADTDGDGLSDGDEVNKYKTDPFNPDTDGDGLSDGDEVNKYKTDPLKTDTDGDSLTDAQEVLFYHTNPLVANTALVTITGAAANMITSGDSGGGLDLQGNFLYAVNVSSAGAAGKAGDADFTADTVDGVRVIAGNNLPTWDTPAIGNGTPNDLVIDKVLQSIRYDPTINVQLSNLVPESTYQVQLLFYEQCCANRGFNIYQDGQLVIQDFSPPNVQGGPNNTAAGAVVVYQFLTHASATQIDLTVNGRTDPSMTDPNAILDGFTVEIIKLGPVTTKPNLSVVAGKGSVVLTYEGTLQSCDTVNGTFTDVTGTSPMTVTTTGVAKFYRARR
jgi:hypothetical protein